MDISALKPFKTVLQHQMEKFTIENACTSFTKKEATEIASIGFEKGIINNPEMFLQDLKEEVYGWYILHRCRVDGGCFTMEESIIQRCQLIHGLQPRR